MDPLRADARVRNGLQLARTNREEYLLKLHGSPCGRQFCMSGRFATTTVRTAFRERVKEVSIVTSL